MDQSGDSRDNAYSIRAVQRVCNILDLIQESPDSFSLNQVAEVTQLPKSSAYRYMATLESRRYIMRDPISGLFRIGPAFLPLQSRQLSVLADRVRPHLIRLRDEFRETFNLGILDGYRVSYVDIVESPHSVRLAARSGDRDQLHCTALGKAIASSLDEERVRAILAVEGMPRRTPATITDLTAYLGELENAREQGYAVDDCENETDGRCIAVPLSGIGLPAAISLSAPAIRLTMDDVPNAAQALADTADLLVRDITGTSD
ncbi:IclR family transcriptional regulator [Phytoactinopolyspora endophytica]|uniref:IclR family transcriptional regulator n=1 Tax=Phytoactinopolyspora endophytica TaxID=1642495 RepID=UPI00101DC75C|nr:IclR family transcriptional regulator [Phytoactinopolyspora endophytica]